MIGAERTLTGRTRPSPIRERSRAAFGEDRGAAQVRSGHLPELDGVRALSILAVLAAHMLPLGPAAWQVNGAVAPAGMSLFFTLSGFLIVRFLWSDQRIVPFLIKRVSRIAPIATVYAGVMCLLLANDPAAFAATVGYAVNYTEDFVPGTGPLWSLCVEMHFYAAIAVLVAVLGRRGLWCVPVLALAITALRASVGAELSIRTHLRADEILAGGCLALGHIRLASREDLYAKARRAAGYAVWLLVPAFLTSCHPDAGPLAYLRPYLGMLVVGCCLYTPFAWLRAILLWRVFAYVAKVSYALYIFHTGTMIGWLGEGSTAERYLIKRPISIAATAVLAHVSTHTIERWFNDAGRAFVGRHYPKQA